MAATPTDQNRLRAVKAALLAAASFTTAVGTLLAIAGEWNTPDETVRYAITTAGLVASLSLGIAALYIWPRR